MVYILYLLGTPALNSRLSDNVVGLHSPNACLLLLFHMQEGCTHPLYAWGLKHAEESQQPENCYERMANESWDEMYSHNHFKINDSWRGLKHPFKL